MTAKPLGVGLLGLGTVGSAVGRAFADRQRRIDAAAGRAVRLIGAAVRDPARIRDAGGVPVVTDPFAILDDPGIAIVIEVIGGHRPAVDLLDAAFERGKHRRHRQQGGRGEGLERAPRDRPPGAP